MMNAILVEQPGGIEELKLVQQPVPVPQAGEVRVRIHAIGVNYADVLGRRGTHPGIRQPPLVIGCEAAGVVDAVGAGVTMHHVGDRVGVYAPPGGTYAERVVVPETYAVPLPDEMSWEQGAAFTHVYLTAWHGLRTKAAAKSGETLFVSAAAGGLGLAVLQIAQAWDMTIIAGAGSDEKARFLAEWGFGTTIVYGREDVRARLMDLTDGRGVDIAIDTVGGDLFDALQDSLAPLGRLVTAGVAGGVPPLPSMARLLTRSATYATLNLSVIFDKRPDLVRESWTDLCRLYAEGHLDPVIGARFPLAAVAEAQALMESRGSTGKILLLP